MFVWVLHIQAGCRCSAIHLPDTCSHWVSGAQLEEHFVPSPPPARFCSEACGRNSADYHAGETCSVWLFRNILRASFEARSNAHWHRGLKRKSLGTQAILFSLEMQRGTFIHSRYLCLNMIKDNHCCFSPPASLFLLLVIYSTA